MNRRRPLALVAENTELGRWAIAHALQAAGFEIYFSATWVESSGWLDRAQFDLAVMALSAQRDDVAFIAGHLRDEHAGTRLIALVPQDDVGEIRRACGPEAVVLAKPLNVEQVVLAARSFRQPGAVAQGA